MTACVLSDKAVRALEETDNMPHDLRQCVHEFGYEIVSVLMQAGVRSPNKIRAVVHTCWMGPRNDYNRNTANAKRGEGSPVAGNIDSLLINSGSSLSAATLIRVLALHNMVIVPRFPSSIMVDASMDALDNVGRVTKREKHTIRLKAAIEASSRRLWPQL